MSALKDSAHAVIAAIDVGTNSVHMVIAAVDPRGFSVIAKEKEIVRLGEGTQGLDLLTEDAIQRGIDALRHMTRLAQAHGAMIVAVATSAVREAENRDSFLREVAREVGINVEIISGPEEARLISLGVGHSLNLARGSVVVVDIGGGSTEFGLIARDRMRMAQSLKIGAVRMTDAYLPGGVVSEAGLRGLRARVRKTVAPLGHDLRTCGFDRVVLSSGTNETIARIIAKRRGAPEPPNFNGFRFTAVELNEVVELLIGYETPAERVQVEGLDARRADIIVAGSVILQEIASQLQATEFELSDSALREGVLIDAAQRAGILPVRGLDTGLESAVRLAERCSVNLDHSRHVAEISAQILRGLRRFFDIDLGLERQLRAAALLAETGNAISYSKHHLHSYYIISNSDLTGFTHDEIETIALAARYHRKTEPRMSHQEFSRLSQERRFQVELMAAILRVATGLDRSHDQCVLGVSVSNRNSTVTIMVQGAGHSVDNLELNCSTAQENAQMLADYLGEPVLIKFS